MFQQAVKTRYDFNTARLSQGQHVSGSHFSVFCLGQVPAKVVFIDAKRGENEPCDS